MSESPESNYRRAFLVLEEPIREADYMVSIVANLVHDLFEVLRRAGGRERSAHDADAGSRSADMGRRSRQRKRRQSRPGVRGGLPSRDRGLNSQRRRSRTAAGTTRRPVRLT